MNYLEVYMTTTKHVIALTVFAAMAVSFAFAEELTGKEIMQKVDKRERRQQIRLRCG